MDTRTVIINSDFFFAILISIYKLQLLGEEFEEFERKVQTAIALDQKTNYWETEKKKTWNDPDSQHFQKGEFHISGVII